MMLFTVPADFKTETIEKMLLLEKKYPGNHIREVFGNISATEWPSGHGFLKSQKYASSKAELKAYIAALHEAGYEYNYTFNAGCLENRDIVESEQKKILLFVEDLLEAGIDRITVASPVLIEKLHTCFPKLKITASAILAVNSLARANMIAKLGASTIVLEEDLTRDFKRLKNISMGCKAETEIIVNTKCTFNCMYRTFHYNSVAHDIGDNQTVFNYGRNCAKFRRENPVEYIKSLWIRPEDLETYQEHGIRLFKLIGRERLSDIHLLEMIEAYFSRNYEGNLMDLIFGFSNTQKHIYIDNKKLDGFLDKFTKSTYECLDKCEENTCNYCKRYLEKSLIEVSDD